jgi:serine phosphatase RsbU (regulator of sigma subunit)
MSEVAVAALLLAVAGMAVVLVYALARARRWDRRFQILDDIARVADGGRSLEQTLDAITAILVPEFCDFCTIDVVADGHVRRAAVKASGAKAEALERGLAERQPALQQRLVDEASASPQQPRVYERVGEADLRDVAADEEDLQFLLSLGVCSSVTVELRARRRVTGMLTMGASHSGRRFRADAARFAWVLAGRVALALDNAGLFSDLERSERERAEIAATLQRGLLPPPLPDIPGWSLAAMYRPAGAENEIGGDFYDAFQVAGGWMVVVGDVTGRGAYAATITAQARYTLRAAAALTGDPVVALEALNRALLSRRDAALCSVAAVAIADEPERPVRIAVAGHPPPLLVDGEAAVEAAGSGPVLGAFADVAWDAEEKQLERGQQLVIVTDGITEASGEQGRFGEQRLHEELAGSASPALTTQRLEGALHGFTAGRFDDDAAILALCPAPETVQPAPAADRALIERLFDAFNHRDAEAIVALCDEGMEFFPVGTAEAVGRAAPYLGPAGLREYLADVDQAWEELLITPMVIERRSGSLLVRGRVYARSRELGIRDMPVAWIWETSGERFLRGEIFPDPEQAILRFAASA